MADAALPKLQKLPGFALNVLGVNRAWLAEDHLLVSSSAAAFETYRRYYFREIKAVVVRPTVTGIIWKIILGLLLTGVGIVAVTAWLYDRKRGAVPVGAMVSAGVWLVVAAVLTFQVIRGKTCRVYVQTRAGIERLAAPVRLPAAYKLLAALRPRIAEAQGTEVSAAVQPPPPPPAVAPIEGGSA